MIIIGITGTLGAGKGTIVDYLVRNHGFVHFSVREYLVKEITLRGLRVNRDNMVLVANELRAAHYPSYIVEQLYNIALQNQRSCVIESIRTPGEAEMLKTKGNFYLFAVDADAELRYHRISLRASETDHVSFDTFIENEKREMTSEDPNKQNLKKCIEMADYVLLNNGCIDDLYNELIVVLNKIDKDD
ncbi:MAG: AAA family ATPase [Bacteroidota bacterium]